MTPGGDTILLEHHPDIANRPAPRPGRILADRLQADLTWNVFRALGLVRPAFWVRRLRARLGGLSPSARVPSILDVRLWPAIDSQASPGHRDVVHPDVLVVTDTAVVGIVTLYGGDLVVDDAGPDHLLRVVDAVSREAGVRECDIAVVVGDPGDAPVASALVTRYAASREALLRRLPHRRDGLVNLQGIGRITWRDLASILRDCADSTVLTALERCAAGSVVAWLADQGITPAD